MSVEFKLFVGNVSHGSPLMQDDYLFFETLGYVELLNIRSDSETYELTTHKETIGLPVYLYDLGGNKQWTEDYYGKPLIAIGIDYVIAAIKSDLKNYPHIRMKIALSMLQRIRNFYPRSRAVLFGH